MVFHASGDDRSDDNDNEEFKTITKRTDDGTVGLKDRLAFW